MSEPHDRSPDSPADSPAEPPADPPLSALPLSIYEADAGGGLRAVSAGVEALTGYTADELRGGRPLLIELTAPEARGRVREARAGALAHGARLVVEHALVRRDGARVWVEEHAQPRDLPGGERVLIGVWLEREAPRDGLGDPPREPPREPLGHARVVRDAAAEALGELAAAVAHEVNNPLSGVLNYAELSRRLIPDDARLEAALSGISEEARRIQAITAGLVALARRGDSDAPRPLHPAALVQGLLTLHRRRLREELVQVEVEVPADLPPIRAQGYGCSAALHELLLGARAALSTRFPGRDPDKRLVLRGHLDESGGAVVLEVEDWGGGSPAGFDPSGAPDPARLGVGVTIARELAEAQGGELRLQATPQGLRASLVLPVWLG